MKLQRAKPEDAKTLLDIEKTAIGLKTYSPYLTKEEIEDCIKSEVVYLIKEEGKIVGSISYEIKSKNHAYISWLIIGPEFRNRGLAKQAMKRLIAKLEDYQDVDLVVHPDNAPAIKLYESLGFIGKEIEENFFDDGEPRLLMALKR